MMRLQKYISHCGAASRRHAERLIAGGHVKVNGQLVTQLGTSVDETKDTVEVDGGILDFLVDKKVYVLNKPLGVVSTMEDPQMRPCVGEIIKEAGLKGFFPIGRLDIQTTGLLPITNDGDLANMLMHPSNKVPKTYRVRVSGAICDDHLAILEKGVDIGDFVTSSAEVELLSKDRKSSLVNITIHEGKNRQVRRMFGKLGYSVVELERISYGDLELGGLEAGEMRLLCEDEIHALQSV